MKEGKIQLDLEAVNQPRTLFKPGSWFAKIDFINHLILFNNVLITVLSEKDGGKTSFGTLLQNNLDQQIKSISMTIKPPCDSESVINNIAAQLHLNYDAQTNISSVVTQVNERKAHVLLVIDDAQHLPESFIKEAMLAIKNQENFGFFHLCLVSDYSVVATLNNLAVEQFNNLIHTIELGSLNESETRTYVLQRAMNAGLINRPLTDAQFKQFYQLTKGNLAKINSTLEHFIFNCSPEKKKNKTLILKRTSLALTAAIVAGISYLYFDRIHFVNPVKGDNSVSTQNTVVSVAQPIVPEQLVSQIPSWQDSSTTQLVQFALPKKQSLDDFEDNEEQNITTVALVDKVVVIPTVKARNPIAQAVVNVPSVSQVVEVKEISPDKLVKQPVIKSGPSLYTIQLVASHKMSDVDRFRKNNNLMTRTKVRQFTNAKGTWYILTVGEFDKRSLAQLMVKKLPAKLAKLNPWVRPVSGLSSLG
jgi:type II secretory pathway predicted ATPase ExeA